MSVHQIGGILGKTPSFDPPAICNRTGKMLLWFRRIFRFFTLLGMLLCSVKSLRAAPFLLNTNLQLRLILNTTDSSGAGSVRIAKDPRNNQLYYLKWNGDIYQVTLMPGNASTNSRVYTSTNHGISESA